MKAPITQHPGFKKALPFAVYMFFILVSDLLKPLVPAGMIADNFTAIIYPIKILSVTGVLIYYWRSYDELRTESLTALNIFGAIITGILVFVLWINMDWKFAAMGTQEAYDPHALSEKSYYAFLAVRLAGAALIVPVFEEIFWRSFVLRYIIDQDFTNIKIGTFTWMSFILSSLLFGSEHNLWLAGIMAGVLYNLLLYRSKSIYACIIAHGVTNLLLGIYVIKTGNWQFW